jgi:hypothetical protein
VKKSVGGSAYPLEIVYIILLASYLSTLYVRNSVVFTIAFRNNFSQIVKTSYFSILIKYVKDILLYFNKLLRSEKYENYEENLCIPKSFLKGDSGS